MYVYMYAFMYNILVFEVLETSCCAICDQMKKIHEFGKACFEAF